TRRLRSMTSTAPSAGSPMKSPASVSRRRRSAGKSRETRSSLASARKPLRRAAVTWSSDFSSWRVSERVARAHRPKLARSTQAVTRTIFVPKENKKGGLRRENRGCDAREPPGLMRPSGGACKRGAQRLRQDARDGAHGVRQIEAFIGVLIGPENAGSRFLHRQ